MQIEYVMSVITDPNHSEYVMIAKNRPDFLKGKTTFIGGKVEVNGNIYDAMVREAKEECGLCIDPENIGLILGEDYVVYVFCAVTEHIYEAETMEDEVVRIYTKEEILESSDNVLADNVKAIIHFSNGAQKSFTIRQ